jgi:two-component system KDP operon response regulator KdpE
MNCIALVDDEPALTGMLTPLLEEAGYRVLVAHTAEDGLQLIVEQSPDLALLDIMIPVMGGLSLCRRIRARFDLPIIFLTALGDVESVVQGLSAGADDYLVKPCQSAELLARIQAHLRRVQRSVPEQPTQLTFSNGDLVIDFAARQVTVYGELVELTPREFELLSVLVTNAGRVVTTKDLIQNAWGTRFKDATDNVKPYIHYLRRKMERDPASPRWIVTARGVGYRFVDE